MGALRDHRKGKEVACRLGNGHILVELDHDDELTDYALGYVVNGFKQFQKPSFCTRTVLKSMENGVSNTYRRAGLRIWFVYRR